MGRRSNLDEQAQIVGVAGTDASNNNKLLSSLQKSGTHVSGKELHALALDMCSRGQFKTTQVSQFYTYLVWENFPTALDIISTNLRDQVAKESGFPVNVYSSLSGRL